MRNGVRMAEIIILPFQEGISLAFPALFAQHAQPAVANFVLECLDLTPVCISRRDRLLRLGCSHGC